jgi:deoxyadenosine/deoxycytidine kinase
MANLFGQPRFIAVEGPIRAGKSSLAQVLAETLHARRIAEPEDNPFLDRFYQGQPSMAFATQMWFLMQRHEQMHEIGDFTFPVVADYLFEKDKIFAYINLDNEELKLYERYFEMFATTLKPPDLVIYLQATPEVLRARIAKKKSSAEKQISRTYLEEVVRAFDHFFFRYSSSDLLVINTSEIDFVERNADLQQLLRRLGEPVKGTQYFLPLGATE